MFNTLECLNDFRAQLNMQPLKSWKESKAKLEEAINKLRALVAAKKAPTEQEAATQRILDNKAAAVARTVKRLAADAIKATKKSGKEKVEELLATKDAYKSVADYCKEAGINPKIARAKLRKAGIKQVEGRWIATVAVRKILEVNSTEK